MQHFPHSSLIYLSTSYIQSSVESSRVNLELFMVSNFVVDHSIITNVSCTEYATHITHKGNCVQLILMNDRETEKG